MPLVSLSLLTFLERAQKVSPLFSSHKSPKRRCSKQYRSLTFIPNLVEFDYGIKVTVDYIQCCGDSICLCSKAKGRLRLSLSLSRSPILSLPLLLHTLSAVPEKPFMIYYSSLATAPLGTLRMGSCNDCSWYCMILQ